MFSPLARAVLASVPVRFPSLHSCALVALFSFAIPAVSAASTPADSLEAEYALLERTDSLIVASLDRMRGVVPGSDTTIAWALFQAHPRRTITLVMPTLRSVPRGLALGAPNMVWRVRVLQRLTGLQFRARTRTKLGAEERSWLAPDSTGAIPFAGENAPRGMTWVAPRDAQRDILAQWRAWFDGGGASRPLPAVDRTRAPKGWWH